MSALSQGVALEGRGAERKRFVSASPFAGAAIIRLGSDASIRQYFRLDGGPRPALLMDAPDAATAPPCPPGADPAERERLGYGALVRGSGSSLIAYEAAARMLAARGVRVPEVLRSDVRGGFAIIEDLGAARVADVAHDPAIETRLYQQAADLLDVLRSEPAAPGEAFGWAFQTYDALAYRTEAALLAQWYFPKILHRTLTEQEVVELDHAWAETFDLLSAPNALVHRDFHADNLMVVGDGIGVLDFQDLMIGQPAYDWASLIEDARRDVSIDLRTALYQRGVARAANAEAFERDYAILAAQRNAKILGLFARLAARDGKERYLDLIPRVLDFFREDLERPALARVQRLLQHLAPEVFVR